jgi:hypothetical protein
LFLPNLSHKATSQRRAGFLGFLSLGSFSPSQLRQLAAITPKEVHRPVWLQTSPALLGENFLSFGEWERQVQESKVSVWLLYFILCQTKMAFAAKKGQDEHVQDFQVVWG